ncbi:MAG: PilZ domain-containing protein [Myxococcota bacterium]|nr:PilZ domain-containing protein [Myxococcota bacterium]
MAGHTDRAPRYHVNGLSMIYDTGDGFWSGSVIDVSETGLFIETHHELSAETVVTLMPDVSEEEQLPFEIKAKVVRTIEYDPDNFFDRIPGLALSLVEMSDAQKQKVAAFLQSHGVPCRKG